MLLYKLPFSSFWQHSRLAGSLSEAAAVFQRALLIDPNLILAHFLLAQTYYGSGLVKEAIAAYTRVLELHPQHCEARFNLVEAMYQGG